MRCPKCKSENVQVHYEVEKQGFSGGKGCCGWILLGPIGLLCGLCGKSKVKSEEKYWVCNNCGAKFTDHEALSTGGGVSFVSNNSADKAGSVSTEAIQHITTPNESPTQIEIPQLTYGGHILNNGHVVSVKGKTFYDAWGICVDEGGNKARITERGSFLLSDGEMVYGFHMENLKDKRHIVKWNPDTYEYECIASFNHIIVDIHMNHDVFAFSNDDDNGKLYLMNKDGTNIRKLVDDKAGFITIWDEWIYYINNSDKKSIYKIKLDGTGRTKVYGDKKCINLVCDGKYLYFEVSANILNTNLYRIQVDGSSLEMVAEDINSFIVTDTGIFINKSDNGGHCVTFCSYNNPQKSETLLKAETICHMAVENGKLYYGTSQLINAVNNRLDLRNGEIEQL